MAIKRTVLSKVGLLDEQLGTGTRYGSSEETDLVLRVLSKVVADYCINHAMRFCTRV